MRKVTFEELTEKGQCTLLAAELVINGMRYAIDVKQMNAETSRHLTAAELCDAVKETAAAYYGPSIKATLTRAGILRSDDIGRIVFLLIEQDLLSKQEGETLADFDGLFETARL